VREVFELKFHLIKELAAAIDAQAKAASAEAAAARAAANVSSAEALIAHLKLAIEKPQAGPQTILRSSAGATAINSCQSVCESKLNRVLP
jgi:hypothetical protein